MSRKRLGRAQRAATIVPLALLCGAWTYTVAGIGGPSSPLLASEQSQEAGTLADGTSVPSDPIDDPASLSSPGSVEGFEDGNDADVIAAASTNEIPSAALAAYQRAESVINSADKSCKLTWQLVAAIGRVESNHGRFGGNVLDDDGVATPGILGMALNGKNNTKAISDTDGGQFDDDERWDRAVGPMQFIPSTWSVVGVDADGDGQRNPQDIDDAALASAVYLCSGKDDLSTVVGQRAAVYRYNNSQAYVDLVLKIMDAYLDGDYTSVPNNSTAAGYLVPGVPSYDDGGTHTAPKAQIRPGTGVAGGSDGGSSTGGSGTGSTGGTGGGDTGGTGGSGGGGTGGGDTGNGGGDTGGGDPVKKPLDNLRDTVKETGKAVEDTVEKVTDGVGEVTNNLIDGVLGPLTSAEARAACEKKSSSGLLGTLGVTKAVCLLSYGLTGG